MATTENWNAERTELILYADNESSLYGQKKKAAKKAAKRRK